MAALTSSARNALPSADFAGPDRSFPIEDASHARNALSRAHFAPNPAAIRAKVHAKFPGIGGNAGMQRDALLTHMKGMSK